MQKWSQSRTEQWNNVERVMEKEREWKEKTKGTDWSFGAGCTMGGKLEGQEGGLGGLFVGRGRAMWSEALLGSCWEAKEPAG